MAKLRATLVPAVAGLLCLTIAPAYGQGHRGLGVGRLKAPGPAKTAKQQGKQNNPTVQHAAPLEQFEKMPPDQRERELAKLPADKREKIQRQLQRYDQLTPAQREQVDWFTHLPPERQNAFRSAYKQFQTQPAERQQAMREEFNRVRNMPDSERQAWLASPGFRSRFNPNEQQILTQMSGALPAK